MKRLISATLALSLLGGTAAAAAPNDHADRSGSGYQNYNNRGYDGHDRVGYDRGRGDNDGAVAASIGFLALAAIIASHNHNHYHQGWHHDGYGRDGGQHGDSQYRRDRGRW